MPTADPNASARAADCGCSRSSRDAPGSRSASRYGTRWATAFFMTRALLTTWGRNILPAPNRSPTTFIPSISGPSITSIGRANASGNHRRGASGALAERDAGHLASAGAVHNFVQLAALQCGAFHISTAGVPYFNTTPLGRAARLVIGGVRPGAREQATYTLVPQSRGRYLLGPLVVDVSDPFALSRFRLQFDEREELLVTPEIEDLGAAVASSEFKVFSGTLAIQPSIAPAISAHFSAVIIR